MKENQTEIIIPVNDDTKLFFHNLLWLSYQKPVIRKGNYFNRETMEDGNICSDIQDFIYEFVGWCVTDEKVCKLKKYRKDWEKKIAEYKKIKTENEE